MEINLYTCLIWLAAITIGSLGLVVFLGSRNLSSRAFSFCTLWVAIWITCVGLFVGTKDIKTAIFFSRLTYYLGSVIATSFLYFFLTYPDDKRPKKIFTLFLLALQIIYLYLFLFTDKIISGLFPINAPHPWGWHFGILSFLFELSFFSFFIFGICILYKKFHLNSDPNVRANLKYMIWTIIVGATPPSLMCIILPRFGYFGLNWLGPVTEILWIPIIAYSIIKYRQMSIRAVITEVLAIAMAVIFFINIFIDTPFGKGGRVATFIAFLILAYYLIRGVLREADQRQELNNLNQNLNAKVAEQTVEIRKSYEAEKRARIELEKLNDAKDQFIMITQHHLRTPLTGITWELGEMAGNAYGKLDSSVRAAVEAMRTSAGRLMRIVDDFLNITAIKVGTNILNLSSCRLRSAVEDILEELKDEITERHLSIAYPKDDASWPELTLDCPKMREVLFIVVENSVRYNHDGGSVKITTETRAGSFRLIITNTGLGITDEEKDKIGSSLFYRGQSARSAHPIGMGIGLSVVKAIVKAHHGTFTIESDGKDHGARVTVNLPTDNP